MDLFRFKCFLQFTIMIYPSILISHSNRGCLLLANAAPVDLLVKSQPVQQIDNHEVESTKLSSVTGLGQADISRTNPGQPRSWDVSDFTPIDPKVLTRTRNSVQVQRRHPHPCPPTKRKPLLESSKNTNSRGRSKRKKGKKRRNKGRKRRRRLHSRRRKSRRLSQTSRGRNLSTLSKPPRRRKPLAYSSVSSAVLRRPKGRKPLAQPQKSSRSSIFRRPQRRGPLMYAGA